MSRRTKNAEPSQDTGSPPDTGSPRRPLSRTAQVLAIVKTDNTFSRRDVRGESMWVGRCFHCSSSLVVSLRGDTFGATIEHIIPRSQGGTEELANLALACERCNQRKGASLDARKADDPRVLEVSAALQERRKSRWRDG